MITRNPMQLKAYIKKIAAEKNISAQLVMQKSGERMALFESNVQFLHVPNSDILVKN